MKILYVKNGSERNKKFQLQTTVFEENGQKFVKKSALCKESLIHLYEMKGNYSRISDTIVNPKVKLAKIVKEDENSLTFEYIEGESFAKRLEKIGNHEEKIKVFVNDYKNFLIDSFKTTTFDAKKLNVDCKNIFGDLDYSILDGEICFDGISNIDLIFSNIIYKNDEIYIIDYEWVFECSLPINYVLYRSSLNHAFIFQPERPAQLHIYKSMESNFIWTYVYKEAFYKNKENYNKTRLNLEEAFKAKDRTINEQEQIIWKKDHDIKYLEKLFYDREKQLHEKNLEIITLEEIVESMRLKNRVKNLAKRLLGF